MSQRIPKSELLEVQITLLVAIALQFVALKVSRELLPGSQYLVIIVELVLAVVLGFTARLRHSRLGNFHHALSIVLLGILSLANIIALGYVLRSLIANHVVTGGEELLVSAIAIFITNIIVFALWYWEIDSPGLSGRRWSRNSKDFQFTQQDLPAEFPGWQPQFGDYLFLAITNAVNFAPADTRPLTQQAKGLMASQSLVSVFTLALVIARSVNVLGA